MLVRKAKAGEQDNGFCAGSGIEKVELEQAERRINQLLAQTDAEVRVTWATPHESNETVCFHLVFGPSVQREGKKCRATEMYGCRAGGDCSGPKNDSICEERPGEWE